MSFVNRHRLFKRVIDSANGALKSIPEQIKRSTHFIKQDKTNRIFPKTLLTLLFVQTFSSIMYDQELKIVLNNISKILKENGILVVRTETIRFTRL